MTMLTQPNQIALARLMTLRAMLKLEMKGISGSLNIKMF